MLKDIVKYYIRQWYVFIIIFVIVSCGTYVLQKRIYDWESAILLKHIVIDLGCGFLIAVFAVFAMFAWKKD